MVARIRLVLAVLLGIALTGSLTSSGAFALPRAAARVAPSQDGIGDPTGMTGTRLEVNVHIVTCATTSTQNTITCVNRAGLEVVDTVLRSEKCRDKDLTDPILMHLATGLRVSEVLGLLWREFDPEAKTIAVSGRVVRVSEQGLRRTSTLESSKATAPVLALPQFAVDMLLARAKEERPNLHGLVFPSSVGTLRDPSGFARQWRAVRDGLGEHLSEASGHSFRKTLSNLVTDHTADPRVAADVLGHSDIQTTIRHYLSRGKLHPQVATMMDNAVRGEREITQKSMRTAVH